MTLQEINTLSILREVEVSARAYGDFDTADRLRQIADAVEKGSIVGYIAHLARWAYDRTSHLS